MMDRIGEAKADFRAEVEAALPRYGRGDSGAGEIERLSRYLALVAEGNERTRLVGDAAPRELARRHLGESLLVLTMLAQPPQRLVDIGSGAGFPGLALAAADGAQQTTLVESTRKKAEFLAAAVRDLGLDDRVRVLNAYLERRPTATAGQLREVLAAADLVTLRAVERMELTPGWLGRWLSPGTQVAFWTSQERVASWKIQWPQWQWSEFRLMPEVEVRGIQLARWPG